MSDTDQGKVRFMYKGFPREAYFYVFELDGDKGLIKCKACKIRISLDLTEEEKNWIRKEAKVSDLDREKMKEALVPKVFKILTTHFEECPQQEKLRRMLLQLRDIGSMPHPILARRDDESRRAVDQVKDRLQHKFTSAGDSKFRRSFFKFRGSR